MVFLFLLVFGGPFAKEVCACVATKRPTVAWTVRGKPARRVCDCVESCNSLPPKSPRVPKASKRPTSAAARFADAQSPVAKSLSPSGQCVCGRRVEGRARPPLLPSRRRLTTTTMRINLARGEIFPSSEGGGDAMQDRATSCVATQRAPMSHPSRFVPLEAVPPSCGPS